MAKVALYCRLSEEDRNKVSAADDSASIQNQKSMLLQYALQQGWEVFHIYSDDDYTGSDRNRPEFQRLLADAEARKFDIVLCKTQSRFTRELELVEKYLHSLFPLWGIRFVSIVDNADTDNKGNKKSRQINGLVNEWYLVENTHEPIIDQALWDQVHALISEKVKPFTSGFVGIFARKVRCMSCGYTMRSSKSRGRHYLQCSNRHVSKDACVGAFISVGRLEELVLQELHRLSEQFLDREELERNLAFSNTLQAQKVQLQQHLSAFQQQGEAFTKALRELYLDKVRGVLSETDFLLLSEDISQEKTAAEQRIEAVHRQLEDLEARIAAGDNRKELVRRYTNLEHLTREMVELLIDYILVGKRKPGEADPPVEIHWNF